MRLQVKSDTHKESLAAEQQIARDNKSVEKNESVAENEPFAENESNVLFVCLKILIIALQKKKGKNRLLGIHE